MALYLLLLHLSPHSYVHCRRILRKDSPDTYNHLGVEVVRVSGGDDGVSFAEPGGFYAYESRTNNDDVSMVMGLNDLPR